MFQWIAVQVRTPPGELQTLGIAGRMPDGRLSAACLCPVQRFLHFSGGGPKAYAPLYVPERRIFLTKLVIGRDDVIFIYSLERDSSARCLKSEAAGNHLHRDAAGFEPCIVADIFLGTLDDCVIVGNRRCGISVYCALAFYAV